MNLLNRLSLYLGVLGVMIALTACGGNNATSPSAVNNGGGGTVAAFTLAGAAIKGPYLSGSVDVYSVASNGMRTLIQSFPNAVGANGNFSLSLNQTPTGIIEIVVYNGSYVDEVTGQTVTNATPLRTILDTTSTEFNNNIVNGRAAVTPLTSFAARLATAAGGTVDSYTLAVAQQRVQQQFGQQASINTTIPLVSNLPANADPYSVQAGLIIAALAQLAQNMGLANTNTLLVALDDDAEDGQFNGIAQGAAINFNGGTLPSNAGTTQLMNAINAVGGSATFSGQAGIAAILQQINQALSTGTMTPTGTQNQLFVSASGSVINITDNQGHDKLVIATGTALKFIPLTFDAFGNPVAGVATTVQVPNGANGVTGIPTTGQVMAYSYNTGLSGSATVTLVDAYTETISSTIDTYVTTMVSFSGGSAVIVGAVFDGNNGVWLATGDGYFHLNLGNGQIDKRYYTAAALAAAGLTGTGVNLSENFGANMRNGTIISPSGSTGTFGSQTPAIQVINTTQFSTRITNTGVNTMQSMLFNSFIGLNAPDAGSIDSYTNFAVIMNETCGMMTMLDLNNIVIDVQGNFSMPVGAYSQIDLLSPTQFSTVGCQQFLGSRLTGGVIESNSHQALFFEQVGSLAAVAQLSTTTPQINDWVVWSMGQINAAWLNSLDPHGIVITTLSNGKVYGLLPDNGFIKVAVIDIAATLAAPRTSATSHQLDLFQLPANAIRIF